MPSIAPATPAPRPPSRCAPPQPRRLALSSRPPPRLPQHQPRPRPRPTPATTDRHPWTCPPAAVSSLQSNVPAGCPKVSACTVEAPGTWPSTAPTTVAVASKLPPPPMSLLGPTSSLLSLSPMSPRPNRPPLVLSPRSLLLPRLLLTRRCREKSRPWLHCWPLPRPSPLFVS